MKKFVVPKNYLCENRSMIGCPFCYHFHYTKFFTIDTSEYDIYQCECRKCKKKYWVKEKTTTLYSIAISKEHLK